MKKDILVLGIGNLVLCDEGVGIHTVNYFAENNPYENVDALDGGTGGLALIGELQSYNHVIMVDATLDTYPTGTVRRITPRYSSDYPVLMSAHEIGIKEMVDAMILQGDIPHIELIVMSVRNVQEVGMSMSEDVRSAIPQMLNAIHTAIAEIRG